MWPLRLLAACAGLALGHSQAPSPDAARAADDAAALALGEEASAKDDTADSSVIAQEIAARGKDIVGSVECLPGLSFLTYFTGTKCPASAPLPAGSSGDVGCVDEQKEGTLDRFCNVNFVDKLLYCPCCADHLMGDLTKRASLLMPGRVGQAAAWIRDDTGGECRKGMLRTWTLGGGREPSAVCDRGVLQCYCADENWREEDLGCRPGRLCMAPWPIVEMRSMVSGLLDVGDRVRSTRDLEYTVQLGAGLGDEEEASLGQGASAGFGGIATGARGEAGAGAASPCEQANGTDGRPRTRILIVPAGALGTIITLAPHMGVDWEDFPQLSNALVFRGQVMQMSEEPPPPKVEEDPGVVAGPNDPAQPNPPQHQKIPSCVASNRISVGDARCQDMAVEQCLSLYRTNGGHEGHFCEVDRHTVRHCGASVVTEEEAAGAAGLWHSWALQWAWRPNLDWPTHFVEGAKVRAVANPPPSVEKVQQMLSGHLTTPEAQRVSA